MMLTTSEFVSRRKTVFISIQRSYSSPLYILFLFNLAFAAFFFWQNRSIYALDLASISLPPTLFLFFINDIIDDISTDTADGIVTMNDYLIYLILFADDTVLLGKTPEILQHLLDKLFIYCRKWNIEVNIDKTKVQCSCFSK